MGRITEIFTDSARKLWNEWQVRTVVLVSLFMQIILISLGSRRKLIAKPWISVVVWLAYLLSNKLAIFVLNNLTASSGGCSNHASSSSSLSSSKVNGNVIIQSFWMPILILHIGGPDTITAFSLEDNDLWHRNVFNLASDLVVAIYVFVRSLTTGALTYVNIPLFIVGFFKHWERTWVLRSSSINNYKSSLISSRGKLGQLGLVTNQAEDLFSKLSILFNSLEHLFTGLVPTHSQLRSCHLIICNMSAKEAFDLVASELACLYDVLYTKATVTFSKPGVLLRCIGSLSCISVLVVFYVADKHAYPKPDIAATYLLLIGAVLMEVYSFVMITLPDSKRLYLSSAQKDKKWSEKMAQLNLLNIYMPIKPSKFDWILKSIPIGEAMRNNLRLNWSEVGDDLLSLIFTQLEIKAQEIEAKDFDTTLCKIFIAERGDSVLSKWKDSTTDLLERGYLSEIQWATTTDTEFDYNILLWHIATDVCYSHDYVDGSNNIVVADVHPRCRISKFLSDYMLYLLVIRPYMLPKGTTDTRYRDTFAVAERIHKTKNITREKLIEIDFKKLMEDKVIRSKDKSVLIDGCRLAKQLSQTNQKWGLISEIWVEMLTYAATHCGWKEHVQQLTTGGELLTHVALLMAHLGFIE